MTTLETLNSLQIKLEETSSQWNGDESGLAEDRSHAAEKGIAKIIDLKNILSELNIL